MSDTSVDSLEMDGWEFKREEESEVITFALHPVYLPDGFGAGMDSQDSILQACSAVGDAVRLASLHLREVIADDLDSASHEASDRREAVAYGVAAKLVRRGHSVAAPVRDAEVAS